MLPKPESFAFALARLSPIELRLYDMHLQYRKLAFQGMFHANPDYAFWHGWNEMVRGLADIRSMEKELRR